MKVWLVFLNNVAPWKVDCCEWMPSRHQRWWRLSLRMNVSMPRCKRQRRSRQLSNMSAAWPCSFDWFVCMRVCISVSLYLFLIDMAIASHTPRRRRRIALENLIWMPRQCPTGQRSAFEICVIESMPQEAWQRMCVWTFECLKTCVCPYPDEEKSFMDTRVFRLCESLRLAAYSLKNLVIFAWDLIYCSA